MKEQREIPMMAADLDLEMLIREYKVQNDFKKELEKKLSAMKERICIMMSDNEVVVSNDGEILVTWSYSKPVKRFDLTKLKEEMPYIYEQFSELGQPVRAFLVK